MISAATSRSATRARRRRRAAGTAGSRAVAAQRRIEVEAAESGRSRASVVGLAAGGASERGVEARERHAAQVLGDVAVGREHEDHDAGARTARVLDPTRSGSRARSASAWTAASSPTRYGHAARSPVAADVGEQLVLAARGLARRLVGIEADDDRQVVAAGDRGGSSSTASATPWRTTLHSISQRAYAITSTTGCVAVEHAAERRRARRSSVVNGRSSGHAARRRARRARSASRGLATRRGERGEAASGRSSGTSLSQVAIDRAIDRHAHARVRRGRPTSTCRAHGAGRRAASLEWRRAVERSPACMIELHRVRPPPRGMQRAEDATRSRRTRGSSTTVHDDDTRSGRAADVLGLFGHRVDASLMSWSRRRGRRRGTDRRSARSGAPRMRHAHAARDERRRRAHSAARSVHDGIGVGLTRGTTSHHMSM